MSEDILSKIVRMRRADIERQGLNFGTEIPKERKAGHFEFLGKPGAILEIKRASPSKGDIAPDLNPVELATTYADAGAKAISVLTETNFFKGSLKDLIEVAEAMSIGDASEGAARQKRCAILRKDFLLFEDEIDIAYRCGADAVLLIARILDDDLLIRMARRAQNFNMQAFVEVRTQDDLRKLNMLLDSLGPNAAKTIVAGVNSRDLATFHTDPMVPAAIRNKLPAKAVFESGVKNPADAAFARSLGFTGILVGEAVAKNPLLAKQLVKSFDSQTENARGIFWKKIAERRDAKRANLNATAQQSARTPLVKICGNTRLQEDVFTEAELGADLIGFIFAESKRTVNPDIVRAAREEIDRKFASATTSDAKLTKPLLIGVITETTSELAKTAIAFAREGVLDAVQYHGISVPKFGDVDSTGIAVDYGCYSCYRVKSVDDLRAIPTDDGNPRFLLDACSAKGLGGTGERIPNDVLEVANKISPLWLAGGVTPQNAEEIIAKYSPEMIDISSGVEEAPGIKNTEKMKNLFSII